MKIKKLDINSAIPTKAYPNDAGFDLYSLEELVLLPHTTTKIHTGIAIGFDPNTYGLICDRSSMGSKGIKVMGGVIDNKYTGEIIVCLCNTTDNVFQVNMLDKVAQLLILPLLPTKDFIVVDNLDNTERGSNGFGSSNK